ncbi:hypothetical protein EfmJHP36_02980 [Enterococcus faecium]|nr:hypothetical protein EfmJHP36_02980 [Enterococcus faecium]
MNNYIEKLQKAKNDVEDTANKAQQIVNEHTRRVNRKDNQEEKNYLEPIFGSASEDVDLPKYKLNKESIEPRIGYRNKLHFVMNRYRGCFPYIPFPLCVPVRHCDSF